MISIWWQVIFVKWVMCFKYSMLKASVISAFWKPFFIRPPIGPAFQCKILQYVEVDYSEEVNKEAELDQEIDHAIMRSYFEYFNSTITCFSLIQWYSLFRWVKSKLTVITTLSYPIDMRSQWNNFEKNVQLMFVQIRSDKVYNHPFTTSPLAEDDFYMYFESSC